MVHRVESEAARKFLETIPTPAQFMPPVTVAELEALAPPQRRPGAYDYDLPG